MYYRSGNLMQAEDLVQDAFGKLWENCAKVSVEKARSYLFTIANNLFFNLKDREKVALKFQKRQSTSSDIKDPQYLIEEKEFEDRLQKAINALPDDQRTIFLLNRIDKKKYREIAELLDISIKTVEKKMHLALVSLRKIHKKI